MAQDSASSRSLRICHVLIVLRLWLTSRAWESASHQTMLPSAPNKDSSSPLAAGQLDARIARSSRSFVVRACGGQAKHEGTVLGLRIGCFGECLQDPMASTRLSRAIVRCPTWIDTTTSRPRRPLACSAQVSAASEVMRPFSPGATSSWTEAASSMAFSRPPPAPRVRVATPILTSKTATSSTPSPRTPGAAFTPVRGGRTGTAMRGASISG